MFDDQGGGGNPNQAPVWTANVGQTVMSVWEKQGDYGPMHSIKVQRMYNDKQGKLKYSDSFQPGELGSLMILIIQFSSWRQARMDAWRAHVARNANGNQQQRNNAPPAQQRVPGDQYNGGAGHGGIPQGGPDVPF